MSRLFRSILLVACGLLATACATTTSSSKTEQFETSYKAYNRMLRWNEIGTAGMLYVEPDGKEQFIKDAESIKKRAVAITEYRVLTIDCQPEKGTGEVVTEFDYYIMPSNRIKTTTQRQSWIYREENGKGWKIRTPLPSFE